jgi:hypothetical protein
MERNNGLGVIEKSISKTSTEYFDQQQLRIFQNS